MANKRIPLSLAVAALFGATLAHAGEDVRDLAMPGSALDFERGTEHDRDPVLLGRRAHLRTLRMQPGHLRPVRFGPRYHSGQLGVVRVHDVPIVDRPISTVVGVEGDHGSS